MDTSSCSVCCVKKGRERLREALDKRAEAKPLSRFVGVLLRWGGRCWCSWLLGALLSEGGDHRSPRNAMGGTAGLVRIAVPARTIKYVQVQGTRRERLRNSDG